MTGWLNVGIAALVVALVSPPLAGPDADDSLAAARELYAAAEYEDALQMLMRLETSDGNDARAAAQVRAYCLLALGRSGDAEEAIAVVVSADPFYRPSDADASPRVRAAFSDVRRRVLPALVQQQYATAKSKFDARDFAAARDGFSTVLRALADPDVADAASQPPLSDLAMLAGGFRDLSVTAATPPPINARPQPQAVTAGTLAAHIYTADDRQVTPPTAVKQPMPSFTLVGSPPPPGLLDLVIDEHGQVEQASMRTSITPRYDQLVVASAKDWRFAPALLDGRPVRYRKVVQITVQQ